jgi:hypothetical protein
MVSIINRIEYNSVPAKLCVFRVKQESFYLLSALEKASEEKNILDTSFFLLFHAMIKRSSDS